MPIGGGLYNPDLKEVQGIAGTHDSLAYKVHEIELHLHTGEQWYGKSGADNYLLRYGLVPFQLAAGTSSNFGSEVQLSNGDEIEGGSSSIYYDLHRIFVCTTNQNDKNFLIQFWYGTGLFAAATWLTEVPFRSAAASERSSPVEIQCERITCNNKLWARCACETDSKTIDIIIGVHTYPG